MGIVDRDLDTICYYEIGSQILYETTNESNTMYIQKVLVVKVMTELNERERSRVCVFQKILSGRISIIALQDRQEIMEAVLPF